MRRIKFSGLAIFALLVFGSVVPYAGATTFSYTSASSFDAVTNSLSTQTFNSVASVIDVGPFGLGESDNPLNSTTNSGMLPGLTIDSTTTINESTIDIIGPGLFGLTNYAVSSNNFGSGLNFLFSPGVTAVSLDVLTYFSSANVDITVYDSSDVLLGIFEVPNAPDTAGEFFGITTSSDTIGSVDIIAPGAFVGADQVQFGSAGASTPVVPEPSSLWLLGSGLLGIFGTVRRKLNV